MTYASLPCNRMGAGRAILASQVGPDQTTVSLLDGEDAYLPTLQDGDWYYAYLRSPCGDCEHVKVTGTPAPDTLTIVRIAESDGCYPSGSTVEYDASSPAAIDAMSTGKVISVSSPLVYDNCLQTLRVDMDALAKALPGLLQDAKLPLQYDIQTGVLSLDNDTLLQEIKSEVMGWVSAVSPLEYNSTTGVFSLDIGAAKIALGITAAS